MAKIDTKSLGLDIGADFITLLTGKKNLHYGFWEEGAEYHISNIGEAQHLYTEKLFQLLPPAPASILDIGGGCGENAALLLDRNYKVQIINPSSYLKQQAEETTNHRAIVHLSRFEDFDTEEKFDICLFSESFQYIDLKQSFIKTRKLLKPGGVMIISDCFRNENFIHHRTDPYPICGDGHLTTDFFKLAKENNFEITLQKDITKNVVPIAELEKRLYQTFQNAITNIDKRLKKKPLYYFFIKLLLKILISKRRRKKLALRLSGHNYGKEAFMKYNTYLMLVLKML